MGGCGRAFNSLFNNFDLGGGLRALRSLQWQEQPEEDSKYRIFLDRGPEGVWLDLEEYLPGVLAVEIPAQYEPEALKAQAVIARTYIRKQMKEDERGDIGDSRVRPGPGLPAA